MSGPRRTLSGRALSSRSLSGRALLAAGTVIAVAGLAAFAALRLVPGKGPSCCAGKGDGATPGAAAEATPTLPVSVAIPDFSFTERSGRTVGRKDLLGRIWVADFIFTSCAGTCPVMTTGMASIHEALRKVPGAVCVSFSVDPERDTLEALRAYADRFSASPDRWWFLRGPQEEVHRLEYEGFRMGHPTDPMIHSERFVLVDAAGRVRGWYRGTEEKEVSKLLADVAVLSRERP